MDHLRPLARLAAYAMILLLAAVWLTSALASLQQPLLDLAKAQVGDAIISFAGELALSPERTIQLALMLVGLRLMIGTYLLVGLVLTIYQRVRWGEEADEMIEAALFLSAIASIVAASPVLADTAGLQAAVGELLLCALASGLMAYGRTPHVPAASSEVPTPSGRVDQCL
jgi:hypothetical protein